MPGGQLSTVVQYLRKVVGVPRGDEAADRQLLERFVGQHEEAAFAALVKRHGPMVLGVCRHVLRDVHDAEDAFQAAFLVLAKKAGAITKPELLGNWLYGVAYRVAAEARGRRRRRQSREVQGYPMDTVSARADTDDTGAVLHEEIQQLPDKYRLPLVLCCLQGQTRAEASRRLGVPAGTVASRLARARELLRARLARRGLVLPAGAFGLALSQATAPAAVPLSLLQATTLAAVGKAGAGVVSAKAAALAEGVLKGMFAAKVKLLTVVLLTAGVVGTGAGTVAYQRYGPASVAGTLPQVAAAAPKAQPKPAVQKAKPPADRIVADKNALTIFGRVVDEQGQPLAQASVAVVARPTHHGHPVPLKPLHLGSTRTDAQGRFQVESPRVTPFEYGAAFVLARALGKGMGWHPFSLSNARQNVTVQLLRERVIRGRLLDLQGQPARGVQLTVHAVFSRDGHQYDGVGFESLPDDLSPWPGPTTTDDEGRFSLHGVGDGLNVKIHIQDDRYTTEDWELLSSATNKADEVTHTLAPPRWLVGQVTYSDTRKPVPHAPLFVDAVEYGGQRHFVFAQADANGRFRVAPYLGDLYSVTAHAPEGEPYLSRRMGLFPWPRGGGRSHEVNVSLPRGFSLRGKVVEEASGKPVAGALVGYWARQSQDSGDLRARTDAHGRFHLAVPASSGHLIVKGPSADYLHLATSSQDFDPTVRPQRWYYPDGLVSIQLTPDSKPAEMVVMLRRGVTVKGRVLMPDGKPAGDCVLFGRDYLPATLDYRMDLLSIHDGRFELLGCDREKTRRVYFYDAKNQLGAAVELSGKQANEDATVRLAPLGSVRVRYVDQQNKPLANHNLFHRPRSGLILVLSPNPSAPAPEAAQADAMYWGNLDPKLNLEPTTDAEGRFTIQTLIPGATYRILGFGKVGAETKKEFTVEAGQTLDLGDVVLKPEE
jgi:RNA polymerase sigma factor (sigma-70 family)